MPRWESGSHERLVDAAMHLFTTQGYERTTVAEIAAQAGLTERTFFRYFGDKQEVLFTSAEKFEGLFLDSLATSPASAPLELVAAALTGAAAFFQDDGRAWSRTRQAVIDANPSLQERELRKLSALARSLAVAYTERGLPPERSALAAELTVSVFRRSFATWIGKGEKRSFEQIGESIFGELRSLFA